MIQDEERQRKENFKELFSFLIKQERKNKDLYIEVLDKYTIEVIYDNGRYDWIITANSKGVHWHPNFFTMKEFKSFFVSMFKGKE